MKITAIKTFILHVPVTREGISDSTHSLTHWGAPGVIVETDAGITGYGYSGTHAHLPSDRLITECIDTCYAPILIGRDPLEVTALFKEMDRFPPMQWVGRGGIAQLAIGAIDVALWDIKAKAANQPLWQHMGGTARKIRAYNTDGGWLNFSLETLVSDCRASVEEKGFTGVKIKVGSPNLRTDITRLEAVRKAIGPDITLAIDANGKMDLPSAIRLGNLAADLDIFWFEEPLWYDDVASHARLAEAISIPIALGEQLYLPHNFATFFDAHALHYAQPDVARLGGVTPWIQVAEMAWSRGLPVVSHVGDMMQTHIHTAIGHPSCTMLEYIPWLRECFTEPATAEDGYFLVPQEPGAGTTLRPDAIARFGVA
ncbi:mandelate racemase/muconate lactonizing enzyme family protein [Arsenicitalea aurantiaca]|uniref:Mandelate racemase/muconate lactonizing enzyme family protein n=1 Tax=Arsenicitalea aurantiaca TaxID=1783274 RepID=A0A433X3F6_9HYPH|nr:mandelate racemase/muconate lactonizing enzyme family protein [Arsenicitalea aurantiaca]RUT28603.1 mandelate racemase/muconate lactonizing enzyme family protein [Arsenicitalea aurantiaca]